jgi:hypothetical protein
MKYSTIVVGGMGLAGSTLCFNICRNMCEENETNYDVFLGSKIKTSVTDYKGKKMRLIKSHLYLPLYKTPQHFNIFVIRDLRDTVSSMKRKTPEKWEGNELNSAKYNMEYYESWRGKKRDFTFKYEDYKEDPLTTIKKLSEKIGFSFTDEQIENIYYKSENLKEDASLRDVQRGDVFNQTLLTRKHITNNGKIGDYESNLDEETIKKIEQKYKDFFVTHGYEIG